MAAVGKSKEAEAARCRRHPRHRHSAGVCPFCLRDRLSRLSNAAAGAASPSSSASSTCSSGEERVASAQAPPCREARRARLGLLMRQEEKETTADLGAGRRGQEETPEEKKPTKRSNFWARLQQLNHGSWRRKDGCSLAHSKAVEEKSAAPKWAPLS